MHRSPKKIPVNLHSCVHGIEPAYGLCSHIRRPRNVAYYIKQTERMCGFLYCEKCASDELPNVDESWTKTCQTSLKKEGYFSYILSSKKVKEIETEFNSELHKYVKNFIKENNISMAGSVDELHERLKLAGLLEDPTFIALKAE